MIIDYNKNIKVANARPHFNGGNKKPKPTFGQSNPKLQQVHFHENDTPPDNSPTETSTQTMVHQCLPDGGMDPSDINSVMSAFKAKVGNQTPEISRKISTHQRYVFARANQSTNHLVDRGANGGLDGANMKILQETDTKINIVGIDDDELTGLDVVTTAALLTPRKDLSLEFSMNALILEKGDLFMLLDKWNSSTAKWMTDPKLWEVPDRISSKKSCFCP